MGENKEFMNDKEKAYVAACVMKTHKAHLSEIRYDLLAQNKKIPYDVRSYKRETDVQFGKQYKKSRKWARNSSNTTTDFLKADRHLSELFEIVAMLKCIELDTESFDALHDNLLSLYNDAFSIIKSKERIFYLFTELFSIISNAQKQLYFDILIENIADFQFPDQLYNFLSTQPEFLKYNKLTPTAAGFALACNIIDKSNAKLYLKDFLDQKMTKVKYFNEFAVKLAEYCPNKTKLIKDKVNFVIKESQNLSDLSSLSLKDVNLQ